jgi:hypothetical protein
MRKLSLTVATGVIATAVTISAAMGATANRTWVSHSGLASNANLGNPCTPTNPCDTFATALGVTNPGGEINCVDNGSYGAINITQSVTIDCGGQLGAIDVSGGTITAIVVNNASAVVKLRNLTINGNGSNGSGVTISDAAMVTIENCVIQNFNGPGSNGILLGATNPSQLNVSETLVVNNSSGSFGGGIVIAPSGSGSVGFVFDRIRVENNPINGIQVTGIFSTGTIKGFLRDSVVSGTPANGGISVFTNANTSLVAVSVQRSHVVGNIVGVVSSGPTSVAILSNSTVQANGTALSTSSGAAIYSYGNNDINDNGSFGSAPIVIGQH